MNFGAPNWLWALAFLPLLVLLYARAERRSAIKLREFVSPRLLQQLAGNVDRVRRAIRFAFVLFALALAIIALAKPRWGYTYEDVKRRGLDLLFAVDTSRSMLSNDVAPNRLERVKLAAQDLITELQGDRAGLIAFAGPGLFAGAVDDRLRCRGRIDQRPGYKNNSGRRHQHQRSDRAGRHKHLGKARWETAHSLFSRTVRNLVAML
jgi:hypothetical protein